MNRAAESAIRELNAQAPPGKVLHGAMQAALLATASPLRRAAEDLWDKLGEIEAAADAEGDPAASRARWVREVEALLLGHGLQNAWFNV